MNWARIIIENTQKHPGQYPTQEFYYPLIHIMIRQESISFIYSSIVESPTEDLTGVPMINCMIGENKE